MQKTLLYMIQFSQITEILPNVFSYTDRRRIDGFNQMKCTSFSNLVWLADNENTRYLRPSVKSNTSWPGLHTEIIVAVKIIRTQNLLAQMVRELELFKMLNC